MKIFTQTGDAIEVDPDRVRLQANLISRQVEHFLDASHSLEVIIGLIVYCKMYLLNLEEGKRLQQSDAMQLLNIVDIIINEDKDAILGKLREKIAQEATGNMH